MCADQSFSTRSLLAPRAVLGSTTVKTIAATTLMLAVSPISLALAQSTQSSQTSSQLPPLVVEGQKAKAKKKPSVAKKSAPPKQKQDSPTPQTAEDAAEPVANATGEGATKPGGNPYANPDAPYQVQKSASGKLTEPLVNTPRTVTAVPKEVIQDKGTRDLRDLAREAPGLSIGSAEGGNSYSAFAIRGYKANNDLFVDGIRNPGNLLPDVFSIEQVEIYKGPSGGIAGRSTIGGAINLITKQPDLNMSFYEVSETIGTDNTSRTTLDLNQVVTHDFAVRANLLYDTHDVAGRDFADSERWGGLLSATAKPTENLRVTLDYYRYRNDATPDWGVPVNNEDNVPVTELKRAPRDMWVGMKNLDFMNEEADIGTATVVGKISEGLTLTNKTRVGQTRVAYVTTSMEGYPDDVHHPNRDQTAHLYANQTELNAKFQTGSFKHNVVAGIELSREELDRDGYNVSNNFDDDPPSPRTPRPFPPNPYIQNDTILGKGHVYDATIDTIGYYLTDTIHLSDQWIVNGGIRFDDFERDQTGGTGATGTTLPSANTAKVQADLFSWNVGIVYKPIPIASIYAAYGTAESPIGSELDSTGPEYNGLSPLLVNTKPQEAESIEVGTKWELFNRRLLATAALFQTDVDNARTNASTANVTIDPARSFAGKYRIRGLELGAAGNITREWSLFGGLTLLDTEVLASSNTPDQLQDVGRRLANIPLTQFSLLTKYQLTDKLSLGGQATYGGEVYGGHLAANKENNHTVDWWRFDAFAEYQLTKNIEIEVSGLNLTNELYYDAIYQAADTFAFVAPGRAGYLTLKYKY